MQDYILVKGARENNLKNVTLQIPKNRLVVMTGLSGSGKSTLAFDTLQKECQRQYMESMGMVTDLLSKPKVESISGLSPSISVGQHLTNRNPRSTVGTMTEVFTYIRVLYAKLGERSCPTCGTTIKPSFVSEGDLTADTWDEVGPVDDSVEEPADTGTTSISCPVCDTMLPELNMAHFSFNKPQGACPTCMGLGVVSRPNLAAILDEELSVLAGAVKSWDRAMAKFYANALREAGSYFGFAFDPDQPVREYGQVQRDVLMYGTGSPEFLRHFPGKEPPTNAFNGRFPGVITSLMQKYAEHARDDTSRAKLEKFLSQQVCPDCQGMRLRVESRQATVCGRNIIELSQMSLQDLDDWLHQLARAIPPEGLAIVRPIVDDLAGRVKRLVDVGVGYLSMDRAALSLSGGEAQRLRLAALLGSGLTGVLYVLDEPTTGLHARDTERLLRVLKQLRDLGNTVLVIEHDLEVMQAADYIIDVGPGAGKNGGQIVATGTPEQVSRCADSLTGRHLAGCESIPVPAARRPGTGQCLTVHNATEHNLKDVTASIPLGTLTALTGVSGSGKSTLLFDILDRAGRQRFYGAGEAPGRHGTISGWEQIDKLITIDQTAIGRIPRSNAATYTDAFTAVRNLFAALPAAVERGLQARHFSFNVPGGRCEKCQGAGVITVNMHFLPDVEVICPKCRGQRFLPEVLAVKYRGSSIADVLYMSISEASELFRGEAAVADKLDLLEQVGLGYLQLGQPATTLSGGEAQRIKLAKELSRKSRGHTLYLLDEPTVGLHPHDVKKLLALLQRLVDAGNTVVVIEHNLDIVKAADWVIDFGPEGGQAGGQIMACGTPEQVACSDLSATGKLLNKVLA